MWKRLFGWLPKPFLDEKTHNNAADRENIKTVDYEENSIEHNTSKERSQSVEIEIPLEADINGEQKKLLESWLNDKNHEDDPWVRRILDPEQGE